MRGGDAWRARLGRSILPSAAIALVVGLCAGSACANGGDLPPRITVQGFLRVEDARAVLLLRIPLVLLAGFSLPKRGPGYLDLARIDPHVQQAVLALGRQIEVFENGVRLTPTGSATRLSLPSDASFRSFASAAARLGGPVLPVETDLYWNQGYLDAELDYPVASPRSRFSVRVNMAQELADRITLHLEFLAAGHPVRVYELPGRSRVVPLDPRWHEAAWTFLRAGLVAPFGFERLVFLACLVMPFRRLSSLVGVVLAMTALEGIALGAGAAGALPTGAASLPLLDTAVAVAVLALAIENVVAPNLRRRCLAAGVVGVLEGFRLAHELAGEWQFGGAHRLASIASFDVGLAVGALAALALLFGALALLFAHVTGPRVGVVVASAILGHLGWHWMTDAGHRAEHAAPALSSAAMGALGWWILLGLLAGGAAWFLPRQFGGPPISPFLAARLRDDRAPAD